MPSCRSTQPCDEVLLLLALGEPIADPTLRDHFAACAACATAARELGQLSSGLVAAAEVEPPAHLDKLVREHLRKGPVHVAKSLRADSVGRDSGISHACGLDPHLETQIEAAAGAVGLAVEVREERRILGPARVRGHTVGRQCVARVRWLEASHPAAMTAGLSFAP